MATLDDVRNAGYGVALAWQGWRDAENRIVIFDVYEVTREATQPDRTEPNFDGGLLAYLPDEPQALDDFLELAGREELGPTRKPESRDKPSTGPVEVPPQTQSDDEVTP